MCVCCTVIPFSLDVTHLRTLNLCNSLPLGLLLLLLLQYPVSNILYNITNGLCIPQLNNSAPTYIVIGDGGNIEGLAGV
jgi:hypothetical protein